MIAFHVATLATACVLVADPGQWPVKVDGVLANGSAVYADLRNTSSGAVDLSGWVVSTCAGGAVAELAVLPAGSTLPPGGQLLLAGPDLAGTATEHVAVPSVTGDGHVLLDRRGARVDAVAAAPRSPCRENQAATPCGGLPLRRDPNSRDTDENRADFTCGAPLG